MKVFKKLLLLSTILLMSSKVLAVEGYQYLVFDKILSGVTSCFEKDDPLTNLQCNRDRGYFVLSGWVRVGQDGLPSDIGESSVFMELDFLFYRSDRSGVQEEAGVSYCRKAITLVKSNPEKWDLKIGSSNSNGIEKTIYYCEVINQSLMKQYYAEQ